MMDIKNRLINYLLRESSLSLDIYMYNFVMALLIKIFWSQKVIS